jgi:parallel beta-helix repeat protein
MVCRIVTIAIALFLLLATVNVSAAKKIVVPADVSSIQAAIDKTEPGDTVYVKNGTYKTSLTLRDDIVLMGESLEGTIIHGNGSSPVIKAGNGNLIRNLTIENGGNGISCDNISGIIENTVIRNNGTGIHCVISLPAVRNNIIYRNKETGLFCESVRSIKTEIEHNVLAENGYSGIMLAGRSEVLVENNIFFSNKQYGIWASQDSKRSRIVYNDFYDNRTQFNFYAQVDRTNLTEDPAFPLAGKSLFNFTALPVSMKGKGKDGTSIGIVSREEVNRKVVLPDMGGTTPEKTADQTISGSAKPPADSLLSSTPKAVPAVQTPQQPSQPAQPVVVPPPAARKK